jgi:Nucleotide modification associated domain 2
MKKIYSYVLRIDDGAAPNPFWGVCTLVICKPAIRRTAEVGDWVIGTGSKNTKLKDGNIYDLSDSIVYAMKIEEIKTLKQYDKYCKDSLTHKIPQWEAKDWQLRVGDCVYDYSQKYKPAIRKSVHNEDSRKKDLGGENALLSEHFYYFGEEPRILPTNLKDLIKKNQGHKKIENTDLVEKFEKWISQFEKNRLYAEPQMKWLFDKKTDKDILACAKERSEDDETEEIHC